MFLHFQWMVCLHLKRQAYNKNPEKPRCVSAKTCSEYGKDMCIPHVFSHNRFVAVDFVLPPVDSGVVSFLSLREINVFDNKFTDTPEVIKVKRCGPKRWESVREQQKVIHPGRLAWNLQITHLERKMIFQTSMIMFHVNLRGCSLSSIEMKIVIRLWKILHFTSEKCK